MNLILVILSALLAMGSVAGRGDIQPKTAGVRAPAAAGTPAPVSSPTPQPRTHYDVISGGNPTH